MFPTIWIGRRTHGHHGGEARRESVRRRIQPQHVALSKRNAQKEGVATKRSSSTAISSKPIFSKANVITLFLLPELT
jgi:hypothetical protein